MMKIFRENEDWLVFEGSKEDLRHLGEALLRAADGEFVMYDEPAIEITTDCQFHETRLGVEARIC